MGVQARDAMFVCQSRFGMSRFGMSRFGMSRFGMSRFGMCNNRCGNFRYMDIGVSACAYHHYSDSRQPLPCARDIIAWRWRVRVSLGLGVPVKPGLWTRLWTGFLH